jgi:hypothetical protein
MTIDDMEREKRIYALETKVNMLEEFVIKVLTIMEYTNNNKVCCSCNMPVDVK